MNVVIFQHRITCAFHQAIAKTNAKSLKKYIYYNQKGTRVALFLLDSFFILMIDDAFENIINGH